MPLIADAFTAAQQSAADHVMQTFPVADGLTREVTTAYEQALIRAYLSHPAVREYVDAAIRSKNVKADLLLEAIGGDTP